MTFEQEGVCATWEQADEAVSIARQSTPEREQPKMSGHVRATSEGWKWWYVLKTNWRPVEEPTVDGFAADQAGFALTEPAPVKPRERFHNNTLADGRAREQKVLFSGSRKCLPGQGDLDLWGA